MTESRLVVAGGKKEVREGKGRRQQKAQGNFGEDRCAH